MTPHGAGLDEAVELRNKERANRRPFLEPLNRRPSLEPAL
jgi:hypothetical protein